MAENIWSLKAAEQERTLKLKEKNKTKERLEMIEKRDRYADLVKQVYSPVLKKQGFGQENEKKN